MPWIGSGPQHLAGLLSFWNIKKKYNKQEVQFVL